MRNSTLTLVLFVAVAGAEEPRFLDGPFSKPALDEHLSTCADGKPSQGHRQRRATINALEPPYRAVYLTELLCDQVELHLVVRVKSGFYSALMVRYHFTDRLHDPYRGLLLRDDVPGPPPEIRIMLAEQTLWVGVGPSGRPSLAASSVVAWR